MKQRFKTTSAEFKKAGRNGNATQKVKVLVDGKYFNYDELAALTGVHRELVRDRYQRMKAKVWPVTIKMLGEGK